MAPPPDNAPALAPHVERAREVLRLGNSFDSAITFWRGMSGHAYVHTVYSLIGCPEIPPASVILVRSLGDGCGSLVLRVMCLDEVTPSLNLAQIRKVGAGLGANEVHLHFASGDREARQTAAFDLQTRLGGIEIVGA